MQVSAIFHRNLLHCETLQMNIDMKYSLKWNAYQQWLFKFTGSKASASFIFAHKWFFQVTAFKLSHIPSKSNKTDVVI